MASRTALLAGATGLVGSRVMTLLLESPHYTRVIALVRRRLDRDHPRLEQLIVDFNALPPFDHTDDVFCALGTTIKTAGSHQAFRKVDHDFPLTIARRAVEQGTQQFLLVSSVGAHQRSSNFYLHTKGELEDALAALPFRSLHVFQPSFITGERTEKRPGERAGIIMARAAAPLLIGPLRKYRPISADAVSRAMVEAAVNFQPGRHIYMFDALAPYER